MQRAQSRSVSVKKESLVVESSGLNCFFFKMCCQSLALLKVLLPNFQAGTGASSQKLHFLWKLSLSPSPLFYSGTVFENHQKCRIWISEYWHFSPIFVLLKSGNNVWTQTSGFQKLAKIDHFWHFWWTFVYSKCHIFQFCHFYQFLSLLSLV